MKRCEIKQVLMLLCIVLCARMAAAQDTAVRSPRLFSPEIGVKPHVGYLMAHHTQMYYLVQGHVRAVEVYAEKTVHGKKNWHQVYGLPVVGVSACVVDLGNRTNMGYAITAFPYVKYSLVRRKHFELNLRTGAGLAWLTKSFDRIDNNKNSAIAAPLNASLSIGFEPEWKFKHVDFGLGIGFMHFSNGAWRTPNLGFNIPSLNVWLGYKFNNNMPASRRGVAMAIFQKTNNLELAGLLGAKEIMPANGPKYVVGDVNFVFRRQYRPKSNLLLFADVNYNGGYKKSYENWYKTTVSHGDAIRAGLGFGYGLSMDRLMLFLHNGFYLRDKLDYDGPMYHRLGARYYFDNGIVANFSLRTHFAKADVVEVGAGYRFKLKQQKRSAFEHGGYNKH